MQQPLNLWPRPGREPMGIVPRTVAQAVGNINMEHGFQVDSAYLHKMGLYNLAKYAPGCTTYRWNKKREYECVTWYTYDSVTSRFAAPVWWFVWIMSFGKMGKGLWKVENLTRERLGPAPNQIPLVVNRRSRKCVYDFTECSGRECHGRCQKDAAVESFEIGCMDPLSVPRYGVNHELGQ